MKAFLMIRFAVVISMAMLLLSACVAAEESGFPQIGPQEADRMIQRNKGSDTFVVLDIRTPKEFKAGHIADAVLLDYYSPKFDAGLKPLDPYKTYLVYCRTGNRTGKAMKLFAEAGLGQVYELDGGIVAWAAKKYPIVR